MGTTSLDPSPKPTCFIPLFFVLYLDYYIRYQLQLLLHLTRSLFIHITLANSYLRPYLFQLIHLECQNTQPPPLRPSPQPPDPATPTPLPRLFPPHWTLQSSTTPRPHSRLLPPPTPTLPLPFAAPNQDPTTRLTLTTAFPNRLLTPPSPKRVRFLRITRANRLKGPGRGVVS